MQNTPFLSDRQAATRYGIKRNTIWRWVREGRFPKPTKLSPGCTRWHLSALEKWESDKIQQEG